MLSAWAVVLSCLLVYAEGHAAVRDDRVFASSQNQQNTTSKISDHGCDMKFSVGVQADGSISDVEESLDGVHEVETTKIVNAVDQTDQTDQVVQINDMQETKRMSTTESAKFIDSLLHPFELSWERQWRLEGQKFAQERQERDRRETAKARARGKHIMAQIAADSRQRQKQAEYEDLQRRREEEAKERYNAIHGKRILREVRSAIRKEKEEQEEKSKIEWAALEQVRHQRNIRGGSCSEGEFCVQVHGLTWKSDAGQNNNGT